MKDSINNEKLCQAIKQDNLEDFQLALENGADINCIYKGHTPRLLAMATRNSLIVGFLQERGVIFPESYFEFTRLNKEPNEIDKLIKKFFHPLPQKVSKEDVSSYLCVSKNNNNSITEPFSVQCIKDTIIFYKVAELLECYGNPKGTSKEQEYISLLKKYRYQGNILFDYKNHNFPLLKCYIKCDAIENNKMTHLLKQIVAENFEKTHHLPVPEGDTPRPQKHDIPEWGEEPFKKAINIIHLAAMLKDKDFINLLIANHADICLENANGLTPLKIAIQNNDLPLIVFILNKIRTTKNLDFQTFKTTYLNSLKNKQPDAYRLWLLNEVYENLLHVYTNNENLLHSIVRWELSELIPLCVEAGLNFEAKNNSDQTARELAVALNKRDLAILLLIHETTRNPKLKFKPISLGGESHTPWWWAKAGGYTNIAESLQENGAVVPETYLDFLRLNQINNSEAVVTKDAIECSSKSVLYYGSSEYPNCLPDPLWAYICFQTSSVDALRVQYEKGLEVFNRIAVLLHYYGDPAGTSKEQEYNKLLKQYDYQGWFSPKPNYLIKQKTTFDYKELNFNLFKVWISCDTKENNRMTNLLKQIIAENFEKKRFIVDVPDKTGRRPVPRPQEYDIPEWDQEPFKKAITLIHIAAITGDKKLINKLIADKADICLENAVGLTPLKIGLEKNDLSLIVFILNKIRSIKNLDFHTFKTTYLNPLKNEKPDAYRLWLLTQVYDNLLTIYDNNETLLHLAVRQDLPELIPLCKDAEFNFEAKNSTNQTPLELAAALNKKDLSATLFVHGAKMDAQLKLKLFPLIDIPSCLQESFFKVEKTTRQIQGQQQIASNQIATLTAATLDIRKLLFLLMTELLYRSDINFSPLFLLQVQEILGIDVSNFTDVSDHHANQRVFF